MSTCGQEEPRRVDSLSLSSFECRQQTINDIKWMTRDETGDSLDEKAGMKEIKLTIFCNSTTQSQRCNNQLCP